MTDTKTLISVRGGRYTAHMASLISYARGDDTFADALAAFVMQYWIPSAHEIDAPAASPYLTPNNRGEAVEISEWLLPILSDGTTADVRAARTLAVSWAGKRDLPETAVIGIIGVAIPGPTLGIISKRKKKKKSAMRLLVSESYFRSLTKQRLVRFTTRETGKQLAAELKAAKGDTVHLHPDTFDWTFTDHKVELYVDTEAGIRDAQKALEAEHLPHSIVAKDDTILAITISPSVDEQFIQDQGATKI